MMRVVHFGKFYFPDAGGIESVTVSVARGAASAGHSVSVVCFEKTPAKKKDFIDGVEVIRAPIARQIFSQPLGFKYFFWCLKESWTANIVHLHVPNMLGALCALFIPRKKRLLVHWHSDVINKGFFGKILSPLESALLARADCIVATSQVYADASRALAPYRNKIAVVPIGVPDAKHESGDAPIPPSIEEKIKGKQVILAVGRLVPYKGFGVLIKAVRYLSAEAIVLIVGGGPLQTQLDEALVAAGVSDRVLLLGRVSDAGLHALFDRATLYCLPSIYRAEAFGVVLLEAMAYGLPIVATDIPGSGVPWVNQHGVSGLNVPVANSQALATACNEILASKDLRNKLASGARKRFLSEFTEDASVRRMLHAYDRLVGLE